MPLDLATTGYYTLSILLKQLRLDLQDSDSTAYRWTDASLQRAIDLALDRYSQAAPRFQVSQIPTMARGRIYTAPDACWYVDRIEYPIGFWPKRFALFTERRSSLLATPTLAPTLSGTPGSSYQYAYTLLTTTTPAAETPPSPIATLGAIATNVIIPTGPYGTVARNIYRTTNGGTQLRFLTQIPDNTTTGIGPDTHLPDDIGANAPTTNTTQGIQIVELQSEPGMLPTDATGWIEITAAYKHELDPLGTTVPEQHIDAIALGAQAYALYMYLTTTNDNFDYVDGQFRDRVDDSKAPAAWKAHANDTMDRFQRRLEFIKHESNAQVAPSIAWGDKPVRWDRI